MYRLSYPCWGEKWDINYKNTLHLHRSFQPDILKHFAKED